MLFDSYISKSSATSIVLVRKMVRIQHLEKERMNLRNVLLTIDLPIDPRSQILGFKTRSVIDYLRRQYVKHLALTNLILQLIDQPTPVPISTSKCMLMILVGRKLFRRTFRAIGLIIVYLIFFTSL